LFGCYSSFEFVSDFEIRISDFLGVVMSDSTPTAGRSFLERLGCYTPTHRTLRDLPLAARLVLTVFLISVGLGYFSALVQLHMQHSSRKGEALPSPADVIEVFAGLKKHDPANVPVSKLEKLVTAPIDGAWGGNGSMSAAFFHKDGENFNRDIRDDPTVRPKLEAERKGEQSAVAEWIRMPDAERKAAYEKDTIPFPADKPLTEDYRDGGKAKIQSIITDRCARCHGNGQAQAAFPLENYEQITKYTVVPKPDILPGGWVRSERQMSIEKLTQSTHAHLLSFSMLFALTGFTFAMTKYWANVRVVFGPWVLLFQMADIACWWLARVDGVGAFFAQAIVFTGGGVGAGLIVHILGSILDMYPSKWVRAGLIAAIVAAGGGFGWFYTSVIEPELAAERAKA
jgi:hypothetical protein